MNQTTPKGDYQFTTMKGVFAHLAQLRQEEERSWKTGDNTGVLEFHHHGLRISRNDEPVGDFNDKKPTLASLKELIEEAEQTPGPFEIYMEGHYDWFPSLNDRMNERDTYEPTDIYITITLYKQL